MGGRNGRARIEWLRHKRKAVLNTPFGEEAILSNSLDRWFEIGIIDHSQDRVMPYHPEIDGKHKVDIVHKIQKVIFLRGNQKAVKRKAEKMGEVVFCRKVDSSYFLNKIEYLDLKQVPITLPIVTEQEFTLNKDMELTAEIEQEIELPLDNA